MPKLKILWSSVTPTIESGYGRVTREIVSRLVDRGYDIICHGYQSSGKKHLVDGKFQMLDAGGAEYGMNVLEKYFKRWDRDILITLYDIWAFFGRIEKLKLPWVPYFPIDAEPITEPIITPLKHAYKRVCFSKFAKKELEKVGLESDLIYHGVDTKVFKPFSEEGRLKARKEVNCPEDIFLVGTNGANQWDRKDFPRMIRIFSEFVKRNNAEDAFLYIHANPEGKEGRSFSLRRLGELYGIEKQVIFTDEKNVLYDTGLARMYNTFDVYLSTSRGEGCGLPILEAQACGVPAVVPDNSAQPEWVSGHGAVVPCSDHIVVLTTPLHNKWYLMDIEKAVEALTWFYKNPKERKEIGLRAAEAMKQYDWDKVVDEQWVPFLQGIEKEFETGVLKVWAKGNYYYIRRDKADRPVVFEVVENGCYDAMNLEKSDRVLDIGGHIGTFSVNASDKVYRVYTYEPYKENFQFLKENIAENHKENINVFNKAVVGNKDKKRELLLDTKGNSGGNSFIGAREPEKVVVECDNINEIIEDCNINKIKMDCEGSEYEIIKAMNFEKIDEMIFEYHFNLLGLTKFEELTDYLKENKYRVEFPSKINQLGQCIVHCIKVEIKQ